MSLERAVLLWKIVASRNKEQQFIKEFKNFEDEIARLKIENDSLEIKE